MGMSWGRTRDTADQVGLTAYRQWPFDSKHQQVTPGAQTGDGTGVEPLYSLQRATRPADTERPAGPLDELAAPSAGMHVMAGNGDAVVDGVVEDVAEDAALPLNQVPFHDVEIDLRIADPTPSSQAGAIIEAALQGSAEAVNIWVTLPSGSRVPMCARNGPRGSIELVLMYPKKREDGQLEDRDALMTALKRAFSGGQRVFRSTGGPHEIPLRERENGDSRYARLLKQLASVANSRKSHGMRQELERIARRERGEPEIESGRCPMRWGNIVNLWRCGEGTKSRAATRTNVCGTIGLHAQEPSAVSAITSRSASGAAALSHDLPSDLDQTRETSV
jgi:hypothetical protein